MGTAYDQGFGGLLRSARHRTWLRWVANVLVVLGFVVSGLTLQGHIHLHADVTQATLASDASGDGDSHHGAPDEDCLICDQMSANGSHLAVETTSMMAANASNRTIAPQPDTPNRQHDAVGWASRAPPHIV